MDKNKKFIWPNDQRRDHLRSVWDGVVIMTAPVTREWEITAYDFRDDPAYMALKLRMLKAVERLGEPTAREIKARLKTYDEAMFAEAIGTLIDGRIERTREVGQIRYRVATPVPQATYVIDGNKQNEYAKWLRQQQAYTVSESFWTC